MSAALLPRTLDHTPAVAAARHTDDAALASAGEAMSDYRHTQVAPLSTLLLMTALVIVLVGAFAMQDAAGKIPCYGVALLISFLAYCFQTLTVQDLGTHLLVRYGPIRLFRKMIPYDQMTGARAARSAVIDGWGIHYVPGRGWTYNLWGFDCVEIQLGKRLIRVGTDDPRGLAEFLQGRIGADNRTSNSGLSS